MSTFGKSLTWRRAVKSFGSDGPAPDVKPIVDAIHMTPSSFGITPYEVRVITKESTKKALRPVSYNQPQVEECTHLFVFCAKKDCVEAGKKFIETRQLEKYAPDCTSLRVSPR